MIPIQVGSVLRFRRDRIQQIEHSPGAFASAHEAPNLYAAPTNDEPQASHCGGAADHRKRCTFNGQPTNVFACCHTHNRCEVRKFQDGTGTWHLKGQCI
jgi:hypothetical protein